MKKNLFILTTLFAIFAISGCTSSSIFLIKGQSGKDPNIKAGESVGATGDIDKKETEKFADGKHGVESENIDTAANRNVFDEIKENFYPITHGDKFTSVMYIPNPFTYPEEIGLYLVIVKPNDKNYIIYEISAYLNFPNDFESCKNKKDEIYFLMGADNLINFHKWKSYKEILKICKIIVFDRDGYKTKAIKSPVYKKYNMKSVEFIKFNKVNISSSQLRKI